MKVLTLRQPWASLVVIGAKKWETRSWKPSPTMIYLLQKDGLLIHSSAKFESLHRGLMTFPPFTKYLDEIGSFPLGKIIGFVKLGRVLTTKDWAAEFKPELQYPYEEQEFGNYESGRWAWELTNLIKFDIPIPAKGSLSFWDYNDRIPMVQ